MGYLLITLNDGSFAKVNFDFKFKEEDQLDFKIKVYKPKLPESQKTILTVLPPSSERESMPLVFIGSNGHIYIYLESFIGDESEEENNDSQYIEIKGTFDDAYILQMEQGIIKLMGVTGGILCYFLIRNEKLEEKTATYKLVKISEVEAHYEKISYTFPKGDYYPS